jgi:hypothetical protein
MSVFVSTKCKIADENSDVFIHSTAWSKLDQIVALSVSIVDDSDERETNQILFANNEVSLPIMHPLHSLFLRIYLLRRLPCMLG